MKQTICSKSKRKLQALIIQNNMPLKKGYSKKTISKNIKQRKNNMKKTKNVKFAEPKSKKVKKGFTKMLTRGASK